MLATAAATTLLALALSLSQQKLYQAHADVYLSGAGNLPSDLANLVNSQAYFFDPERAGNTQASLAESPQVAARALKVAGLKNRTPDDLLGNATVTLPASTDILRFSVKDPSAATASRLAGAYATAYTQYRREIDTGAIVKARRQLDRRLKELNAGSGKGSDLFGQLVQQDQQLRTAEALQGSNVAVVRGGSSAGQIQPKPMRNGILGAILGLLLGVGLVFVRDALNTRVRSPEEVQERLGLPLIGRVPAPRRRFRGANGGLAMMAEPYAPGTEVFRMLATNLGFVNLDPGAKSIMFTSATDTEGKSTTIANVAVALARTGSRVTLIDLDLKRPALDRLFELEAGQPGLTSVALGMTELEDTLVRVPLKEAESAGTGVSVSGSVGSLELLPTGPIPPDTAKFVASPRVSDILTQVSDKSDLVLVDAPPIPQVSDAMALAAKVDAVVVVTRLSVVRRGALDELRRVLDNAPVAKLGFILTGVPAGDTYGYGYGYGGGNFNGATIRGRRKERV